MRSLKTLALAMGAVFLLGGLMASSASATAIWFEGESGIQTVTAEQEADTVDKFTITGGTENERVTTCTHAHYTNETATVDETESELNVTPTYSGCTVHPFGSSTVRVNGCDYRFHEPTTNAAGERTGRVQIQCPAGKHIEIEAKLFGTFKCLVTVGSQTPGGHVIYTNTGSGQGRDVTINATLTGIHYTEHNENTETPVKVASGLGACSDGTGNDGTYNGVSIARGRTHGGTAKGVWID